MKGPQPEQCEDEDPHDEKEAIAVGLALIKHYEPTPDLAESDFDKGMQALQRLMKKGGAQCQP